MSGRAHRIDSLIWIMLYSAWQRSSVVEQRTHKPLVVGSNPSAATFTFITVLQKTLRRA
jgi:hypothetical protein